jgi:hypothetical protein
MTADTEADSLAELTSESGSPGVLNHRAKPGDIGVALRVLRQEDVVEINLRHRGKY